MNLDILDTTIWEIVLRAIVVAAITMTVSKSSLFAPLRDWLQYIHHPDFQRERRGFLGWVGKGVRCTWCSSHWWAGLLWWRGLFHEPMHWVTTVLVTVVFASPIIWVIKKANS